MKILTVSTTDKDLVQELRDTLGLHPTATADRIISRVDQLNGLPHPSLRASPKLHGIYLKKLEAGHSQKNAFEIAAREYDRELAEV